MDQYGPSYFRQHPSPNQRGTPVPEPKKKPEKKPAEKKPEKKTPPPRRPGHTREDT